MGQPVQLLVAQDLGVLGKNLTNRSQSASNHSKRRQFIDEKRCFAHVFGKAKTRFNVSRCQSPIA